MRRIALTPFVMTLFIVLAGALVVGLVPSWSSLATSRETCVSLWNAPHNAAVRAEVVARDYTRGDVDGAYVEDRYEGCFVALVDAVGEPWAFYSAARIPGEKRSLRWDLDWRGSRWGIDIPVPEPAPEPNAVVRADGSLSLRHG
jgi:hypothetical protein